MDLIDQLSRLTVGIERQIEAIKARKTTSHAVSSDKNLKFFPPSQSSTLIDMLNSNRAQEVEAILGRFNGERFTPGVTKHGWSLLLKYLMSRPSMEVHRIKTKEIRTGRLRKIIDLSDSFVIYQKKVRTQTPIDAKQWGYRIASSKEENLNDADVNESLFAFAEGVETVPGQSNIPREQNLAIRIKDRYRFIETFDTDKSVFGNTRVDLTYVVQDDGYIVRPIYEVEIERSEPGLNMNSFIQAIQAVTLLVNGMITDIGIRPDGNISGFEKLLPAHEKTKVITVWNNLFAKDIQRFKRFSPFKLYNAKNKPVPLKMKDLVVSKMDYVLTVKYDGIRALILFTDFGTYIIDAPFNITRLDFIVPEENGSILDGEMFIEDGRITFYPFDMLFDRTKDVRRSDFLTRVKTFQKIELDLPSFTIAQKQFIHKPGGLYKNVALAYSELKLIEDEGISTDGLIFQPANKPYYMAGGTKKWKPPSKLTIDFFLIETDDDPERFSLYVTGKGTNSKLELFTGTRRTPYNNTVYIRGGLLQGVPVNQQVVEMKWDRAKKNFVVDRFRPDRHEPNFVEWAKSVWKDIHDPVYTSSILGTDMKIARCYGNIVKSNLLNSHFNKGEIIMDIGSGRGGDVGKWKNIGLKVIAVDPSLKHLEMLRDRAEKIGYDNIDILYTEAEDTKSITNHIKEKGYGLMDGITAFFSLTFFGEEDEKMLNLVNTIHSNLKDNAVFICIVLDGERVKDLLGVDQEYATQAWSISKGMSWDDNEKFGNEIITTINDSDSMVKNVVEYLFPFDVFVDMMKDKGIELFTTYFLSDKDILSSQQDEFMGMTRVAIFKKAPPQLYSRLTPIGVGDVVNLSTPFEYDLVRIGTPGKGSCFFHAIIGAFSKKYASMTLQKKNEYVATFRRKMAQLLDFDTYRNLGNGVLAELMSHKYRSKTKNEERAMKVGWAMFLKLLSDCKEWIGEEMLEYVANTLGVDIYIMNDITRTVEIASDCPLMYKHRPSIVILNIDNVHYETVGRRNESGKIQTVFSPEDPFTIQLYNQVCNI